MLYKLKCFKVSSSHWHPPPRIQKWSHLTVHGYTVICIGSIRIGLPCYKDTLGTIPRLCLKYCIWEWCSLNQTWIDTFKELRLILQSYYLQNLPRKTSLVPGWQGPAVQIGRSLPGRSRWVIWGTLRRKEFTQIYKYCRW